MKPQAATLLPACLRASAAELLLSVKVVPRASRNEIGELLGNELKIKVTAPPVDSAANEALVEYLAETLGCPRGCVKLVRGQTSRHKTLAIVGVPVAQVVSRLRLDADK